MMAGAGPGPVTTATRSTPAGVGPRAVDLIHRKRRGGELSQEELAWLVSGYLEQRVSDGQMAAFLMAGVLRGFSAGEVDALTRVLIDSGETLDLSSLPGPTVDKHSTGGVGDGTTLVVAPLLAAAGARLVKLSGRGLGHTGGTLDKLESIPGMRVDLDPAEMLRIAGEVGCVVAAQSERLVPADREIYALRDLTGTVSSPGLIAASVMSKKLAAGASTIVLDVKVGDGAFMPTVAKGVELAKACVGIGTDAGRRTVALVTAMDQPLGRGIGNALEVAEAVELLAAAPRGRLAEVALALAAVALAESRALAGSTPNLDGLRRELGRLWESGVALERLARMVAAQGGDATVCEQPRKVLPAAPVIREVVAPESGWVTAIPARAVGQLSGALGAGRARKGDAVDPAVGLELHVEVGQEVSRGDRLATVHARTEEHAEHAVERLRSLVAVGDHTEPPPTILHRVTGER
jgi:pyrimidine-nucleoside phosphorylase